MPRGVTSSPICRKPSIKVWVRGYDLVDSPKMDSEPGKRLNLTAMVAPNEAAAAQYYPAIYWYAMLKIPEQSQFGGKSDHSGKTHPERLAQADEEHRLHRLSPVGQLSTRTFPPDWVNSRRTKRRGCAAFRRDKSGEQMLNQLAKNFGGAPFKYYADWTERIAKGELPPSKPTRPQGLERNVVVTGGSGALRSTTCMT